MRTGTASARLVWLILAGVLLTRPVMAQVDTLSIVGGVVSPESSGNLASVRLMNMETVAGVQLTVGVSRDRVSVDSVRVSPRSSGMSVHWNAKNGKVILIDFSAVNAIEPGFGPIMELFYTTESASEPGSISLIVNDAVLSDPMGNSIPVAVRNGEIVIR